MPSQISFKAPIQAPKGNNITLKGGTGLLDPASIIIGSGNAPFIQIAGNVVPVPTATWQFGAVAYKWLEGYFSGTVFAAAGAFDAGTYITWPNYQPSETGVNNAIACVLVDTAGNAITQSAGLRLVIKLAHTLQAGANTLALNGGTAKSIKSHRNPANNISTAYAVGGIVDLMYDGTQYQDMSQ